MNLGTVSYINGMASTTTTASKTTTDAERLVTARLCVYRTVGKTREQMQLRYEVLLAELHEVYGYLPTQIADEVDAVLTESERVHHDLMLSRNRQPEAAAVRRTWVANLADALGAY